MITARGRALATSAAAGILAASAGCSGASTAPAGLPPMPEYPPPDRPVPIASAATTASARTQAVAMPTTEGETDPDRQAFDTLVQKMTPARPAKAACSAAKTRTNCCQGTNDCKGKGNCKTARNACKGMNDCKGQGGCKSAPCP